MKLRITFCALARLTLATIVAAPAITTLADEGAPIKILAETNTAWMSMVKNAGYKAQ